MNYEDLLRWYMHSETSTLGADEMYRIVTTWRKENGHNLVFVVNALCDDCMAIIRGEFLID